MAALPRGCIAPDVSRAPRTIPLFSGDRFEPSAHLSGDSLASGRTTKMYEAMTHPSRSRPAVSPSIRIGALERRTVQGGGAEEAEDAVRSSWDPAGHFPCLTGSSPSLDDGAEIYPESFTAMIISDLLMGRPGMHDLVDEILTMLQQELQQGEGLFYFFKEHDRLPADADCTALGLSVMLRGGCMVQKHAHRALDLILENLNEEGIVTTYFDPAGERAGIVDPVVCCNVLYLAHQLGRGDELRETSRYVRDVLVGGRYLDGTRYYHSPDALLFFAARLAQQLESTDGLSEPLRDILEKRTTNGRTLEVAARMIASEWLDVHRGDLVQSLMNMQLENGQWPADSLFRYGRRAIFFGSTALSSAFALRALQSQVCPSRP